MVCVVDSSAPAEKTLLASTDIASDDLLEDTGSGTGI